MKAAGTNFFSSIRDFLAKRFLIPASACLVLLLGSASQIHAQSVAPITGLAGFDTGLKVIASVDLAHQVLLYDLNPPGADIGWGDGTGERALLSCTGGESDPCLVLGSHGYKYPGTYTVTISYYDPAYVDLNPFHWHPAGPGNPHVLQTTATITAPWNDPESYVIVSIGDSVASGEGNPDVPASTENYPGNLNLPCPLLRPDLCLNHLSIPFRDPVYGYWDDLYSNGSPYPPNELQAWPNQSTPCHRAGWAGPAQAAYKFESTNPKVTFINYACSGAKVQPSDTPDNSVQDAINQLRVVRQRVPRIDALIISAGVNSLNGPNSFGSGFGDLVRYCLKLNNAISHPCADNPLVAQDINNSLAQLTNGGGSYENLAKVINCIDPDTGAPEPSCSNSQMQIPKMVLITEYMDPTHDQNGNFSASGQCSAAAFNVLDAPDWYFFYNSILHPLNQAVDSFPSIAYGVGLSAQVLAVTGIEQDFLTHGVCAGNQRWVYDIADSENLLGPGESPGPNQIFPPPSGTFTRGTFHPIAARYISDLGLASSPCCGQEDYRDRIYNTMVQNSYAVTTASATIGVGGPTYTPGTWAFPEVVVTLAASNPISDAGAKQIIYAIDDQGCNPYTWPTHCLTYSSPFTISTLGQHTVTFSSFNNAGLLGPFQSVQVWVGTNQFLTIAANNATRQYGAADPAFTVSYSGFVNGDTQNTPGVLTGTLTCTSTDTPASPVGTYSINCSGLSSSSYTITYVPGTVTVTQAPLAITANNATLQYGQAIPAFTGTIVGLQNGDSINANYSTSAPPASPVGIYPITPTLVDPTGKLGNYAVTVNSGILTVTAVPLTVNVSNASRQYGQANPAFAGTIAGLQNGDSITANYSTTATPASPAGNYAITATLVDPSSKSGNYAITINNGTLAVTAEPLMVTVTNASRPYGQANPAFAGTIAGLQNGDSITANYSTSATPASPVGNYAITPTLADPGGKLGNYAVTLNNGTLAVTAAPLTITSNNATRGYGQPNPPFGPSYSGFANGENASVLAGTLTCASPATPSSPVAGSPYAITCSGLTSSNYAITYVAGALTVTAAPLTITANSATKILNAALPAFGASYSGFVNGEGPSVLTGSLSCTTTATATSPVGSYPTSCSGLTAANYAVAWAAGTLKVMYAPAGVCGHVILPPIDPAGTTVGNQGRTIPAKFQVCDANAVSIGTPGVVTSFSLTQIITGTATTNVEDIVDTNNPDTAFRWDGTGWIFNITTQNFAAGSTYVYTIILNDGSTIVFQFGLR